MGLRVYVRVLWSVATETHFIYTLVMCQQLDYIVYEFSFIDASSW